MKPLQLPSPDRCRRTPESFSWVDHRLVRDGHVQRCGTYALALYLVLVSVGDAEGVSFYRDETLCRMLRWSRAQLAGARTELAELGLVAFERPFYQVLGLDPRAAVPAVPARRTDVAAAPAEPPATEEEVSAMFARMRRELCR